MRHLAHIEGADIWLLDLEPPEDALAAHWEILSPAERERASAMSLPRLRDRAAAAHGGLRSVLATYLSVPPAAVDIRGERGGKPWVAGGPRFSLSHSGCLGLCAVSRHGEVGVDLEELRPVRGADGLASRFLTDDEYRDYLAHEEGEASEAFLRCWTRREAYLKALGLGLAGLDAAGTRDPHRWLLRDLRPADGYVGALVVEQAMPGAGAGLNAAR